MKKEEQFIKVCKSLDIDPGTIPMIMDIKDALKLLKKKLTIPSFKEVAKEDRNYFIADWSLIMITRAMNLQPDGTIWTPNYTDRSEYKYEPSWFEIKANKKNPSGFGFSYYDIGYWRTDSDCGSRLVFKNRDRLRFVMKQFEGLFEQKILLNK